MQYLVALPGKPAAQLDLKGVARMVVDEDPVLGALSHRGLATSTSRSRDVLADRPNMTAVHARSALAGERSPGQVKPLLPKNRKVCNPAF